MNRGYRIAVLPVLVIIGIFGQAITIKVFFRLANWKATCKIYYSTMAIVDLAYLFAFGIPEWTGEGLDYLTNGILIFKPENFHIFLCRCFRFIWHVTSFASYWTLVMYSVERIIAISNPFLAIKLVTIRTAKIACSTICLFAVLSFSPIIYTDVYLLLGHDEEIPIENRYCFPNGEALQQIYLFSMTLGLTLLLPPIILVITSVVLIKKLIVISEERKKLRRIAHASGKNQSVKSQEVKNSEDLLIISIITLVIALPTMFWIPTVITYCKLNFPPLKAHP